MRKKSKRAESIFISRGRFAFVITCLALVFCAVFARLYYLHVVRSDASIQAADKVRNKFMTISARRGDIVDARKNLLATSRPVITIGVDPVDFTLKADSETFERLQKAAEILKVDFQELKKKCHDNQDGSRWRKIAENIDENTYKKIQDLKIKGIYGNRNYIRVYPAGPLMAHCIGFVNKEFQGVMGIEQQFNFYLKGQDGWIETERDGKRRELTHFRAREVKPTDGMNVELTMDLVIQEIVEKEVRRLAGEYSPKSISIIVSDPNTGYILALANYPSFDPNKYNQYDQDMLRNRAISDQYEPGSTFKIVPISAALNESLVGPDDVFDCNAATMNYKGKALRLPKEAHTMGKLSVREITQKSSNKGSAQLGGLLGENKLYEYAKLFGYGEKTNIGLLGEATGTLHKVKDWDGLTITRLPMGHAVDATPLQVHCAMSVIANQGIYMQPQLIRRIYDKNGDTKIEYQSKAVRRVISPKISTLMAEMLSEVVTNTGTARRAQIEGFKIAGKTGTSQKIINGKYSTREHVASFSGFFPAQRPRLVITVVVDTPRMKGVGYGGIVAAPAFKNIAEQSANYLGIQTDDKFEKTVAWKGFQ